MPKTKKGGGNLPGQQQQRQQSSSSQSSSSSYQQANDTELSNSNNEMQSVNNDGSNHQVADGSTVDRKHQDDSKCCFCIGVPCGATTLLVLEVLYLLYFLFLLATVVLVQMFTSGELKIPEGTFECTHTWDKYGKQIDGKFVKTYANVEACRKSQSFKDGTQITKKAQVNLDKIGTSSEDLYNASEFLYYVGVAMCVCYLPRLFYFCKLCGFQCFGGKKTDSLDDREGLVMALDFLIASQVFTVISTVAITIFVGVSLTDEKMKGLTDNASTQSKWAKVGNVLGNQIFGILISVWWRYDFKKWALLKKKDKK